MLSYFFSSVLQFYLLYLYTSLDYEVVEVQDER